MKTSPPIKGRGCAAILSLGAFLYGLGYVLNSLVLFFNGQRMPVSDPHCVADPTVLDQDPMHVCMVASTHLKILCDWLHVGHTIYSVGDLGLYLGGALVALAAPVCLYQILVGTMTRILGAKSNG